MPLNPAETPSTRGVSQDTREGGRPTAFFDPPAPPGTARTEPCGQPGRQALHHRDAGKRGRRCPKNRDKADVRGRSRLPKPQVGNELLPRGRELWFFGNDLQPWRRSSPRPAGRTTAASPRPPPPGGRDERAPTRSSTASPPPCPPPSCSGA